MEFLGSLGIDWKLLLAQLVNFGLLLWLLSKFLYNPIIKRIEEDEKELEQAKSKQQELVKEKAEFNKLKENKMVKIRNRSQEIIKEAEKIAIQIKAKALQEAEKEKREFVKQTELQLSSQKSSFYREQKEIIKETVTSKLCQTLVHTLPEKAKGKLQDIWFDYLVKEINNLSAEEFKRPILSNRNSTLPLGSKQKATLQKLLAEKYSQKEVNSLLTNMLKRQKISIILEYALPLENKQKATLQKLLAEKFNRDVDLSEKQNKNLISGLRLELDGIIIEKSLLAQIKNASNL